MINQTLGGIGCGLVLCWGAVGQCGGPVPVKAMWSVAVTIGKTLLSHTLTRAVAIAPRLKALVSVLSLVPYQLDAVVGHVL